LSILSNWTICFRFHPGNQKPETSLTGDGATSPAYLCRIPTPE
jgi:hypothetical protein